MKINVVCNMGKEFQIFLFFRLMMQGYKKPLTEDSVFGLKQRDTSQEAYSRFYNNWVTECASAR